MKLRNSTTFPVDTHWTRILHHDWLRPEFDTSSPDAAEAGPSIVVPIALDRASSLHIRNGQGTRIRVASGVLWVTEENSLADHTLAAGDSLDLTHKGIAMAYAHRPSRFVLEVPFDIALPRSVDVVLTEDKQRRRIAFALPSTVPSTVASVTMAIAGSLQSVRRMVRALAAR